jgi:uncharacterized iron-regulated protein
MKKTVLSAILMFMSVFSSNNARADDLPKYSLSVIFDVNRHLMRATAEITPPEGTKTTIDLSGLEVSSLEMEGEPLTPDNAKIQAKGTLRVSYELIFEETTEGEDVENIGVVQGGTIGPDGISLTEKWYPTLEGLAYFSLKVVLPEGFSAVSEADEITVLETPKGAEHTFHFPYPLEGINLAAGKYEVIKDTFDGINLYAYFFTEDAPLAGDYLEHTKKYLKMYAELIGPYPYRRFSVVENVLETGYSLPTFTLLGRSVVRLPFILKTSLGHEVLHQWFGNYVYADLEGGNWLEGLVTYLADHLYKEQEGEGWSHRKKILVDYQSYVRPDNEITLPEFQRRTDFATRSIGYGKGAITFHMLRNQVGEDTFMKTLRSLVDEKKFQWASWSDLKSAFEEIAVTNIEWFFEQWLGRKGVPRIIVEDLRVLVLGGVPTVTFNVQQAKKPYRLNLNVKILTENGEISRTLEVEKEREYFEIAVEGEPQELVIDDGYDVMRALSKDESPPVVSGLLGDKNRLIVVPEKDGEKYDSLINLFTSRGFKTIEETAVKDKDIKTSSLLVLGAKNRVLERLFGGMVIPGEMPFPTSARPEIEGEYVEAAKEDVIEGFMTVSVMKNPLNTSKVVATVYATSKDEVDLAAKKIFRYGNYSQLEFRTGNNVLKETAGSERGMRFSLQRPVVGIKPEQAMGLEEIIQRVIEKPIIYVGEWHTMYEDHKVQLEVVRALNKEGRKFAIGMEMFQRPYQQSLDDYISGVATEKEFLKSSEYFKRWKFNYHLYREVLDFARENEIPVVALNQEEEIVKKVSEGGLDALDEEERERIPEDMDMSDEGYRERLLKVFSQHKPQKNRTFENFHQAQILWDETMAHSIEDFLRENPERQIVVIAGAGHIAYGSGIPSRLYRLNGKDYVTILNAASGPPIVGLADYVLFPEPIAPPTAPPIGIAIEKDEKTGLVNITQIQKGSRAERAGLKKGDSIVFVEDTEITDVDDIYIALFDRKPGETITLKVSRRSLLFFEKEIEFKIEL